MAAVKALGDLKDPCASADLVSLLVQEVEADFYRSEGFKITPAIVLALIGIGRPAVQALDTISDHENPSVRLAMVEVLEWIGGEQASGLLIERMIRDSDWYVGRFAARCLEKRRWDPETPEQRTALCVRFGRFADLKDLGTNAIQPIADALEFDPPGKWKCDAYRFLGELGDPRVIPILLDGMGCSRQHSAAA